jgi:phage shock protein PspC (stress-responsive transcriptional regulator)
MKDCPYCSEPIQESAVKCRYCGSSLQPSAFHREWYRSRQGRKIAGVCAGLAEEFGIAATPIRAAFVLLILGSGGMGILLYIVLWVLMPYDEPPPRRLERSGRSIKLDETSSQFLDRG